jgi:GDPmannose 4,6-dehydratase
MKRKIAFITGVTGQDGSYLAEFLIKKNYIVHGMKRRTSIINTSRIDHLYKEVQNKNSNFIMHYGDMTDSLSITKLINKVKPDEIYNLAAQSHVGLSFDSPEYVANTDGLGALRILESIKLLKLKNTKFYQAGTSEMFGNSKEKSQNENTVLQPCSPYAVAKLYAHWITKIYRDAYKIFACNGILFNHESPVRGENFVTRKITMGLCKIKMGLSKKLYLGNINAKRDWGHAKDYVKAMWLILQKKNADDYVIATGKQFSVKQFVNLVAKELELKIFWKGKNNEQGYNENNQLIIDIDHRYFRPLEVNSLKGDYSKARKILKWKPETNIKDLVKEMVQKDMKKF